MSLDETHPLAQLHNFDIIHKPGCFPPAKCFHEAFTIDGRKHETTDTLDKEITEAKEALTGAGIEYSAYSFALPHGKSSEHPDWPTWRDQNLDALKPKQADA